MKLSRSFKLVLFCLVLASCSNSEKRAELEAYVKKIKSREISEIEPLPEVKPYETFTYKDATMRSPFTPSTPREAVNLALDNGIHPDPNRRKEPLEAFPLDNLRMMGTLEKNGKRWAIVVDTNGTIHRVIKGNYVGQHDGRIDEITEEKVLITEIIPGTSGGWQERKASLTLVDENSKTKVGHK
ncbi:MAG: pilus assembly protein PilP [Proteobacteria bacterium]|nr:pilus assembly protein PilP [Pseudomonadota bacterium]